jgi:hypothetical protein
MHPPEALVHRCTAVTDGPMGATYHNYGMCGTRFPIPTKDTLTKGDPFAAHAVKSHKAVVEVALCTSNQ